MLEHQRRLDQPRHAGGGIQMTDIPLHRSDRAVLPVIRRRSKHLGQRGNLDRIPKRRRGAVTLHVADAARFDASLRQRLFDRRRLTVDARRGETDLVGTVIAQAATKYHGIDVIAVGNGVRQPLEQHHTRAAAENRPAGVGIERPAMTVGGNHPAFLMQIPAMLRETDRNPAGQRHVRLIEQQALAGLGDRHQRGGTGRLDGQARPPQIQLVRHPGGQELASRTHQNRVAAHLEGAGELLQRAAVPANIVEKVSVHAATGEHADRAFIGGRIAPGVFQRLPGAFQENPVLRIGQLRLSGVHAEEAGVELIHTVEHRPRLDEVGGSAHLLIKPVVELVIGEKPHRLDAATEIVPECGDAPGARKAPGHADDGDPPVRRVLAAHPRAPLRLRTARACAKAALRCRARSASPSDAGAAAGVPSSLLARPRMLGCANRSTTATGISNSSVIRACTSISCSEVPPRSKKLSSTPTLSTPSTRPQICCKTWDV